MAIIRNDCVGVVVATCDRPSMLSSRSIPSILEQSHPPDFLVIVDDSRSEENRRLNTKYVHSLHSETTRIEIIPNCRTIGASGAWNTGIDWVFEHAPNPESTFLAILDDDDAWRNEYVKTCLSFAQDGSHDMVAADIIRIESQSSAPIIADGPSSLNAADFLIGNPGVQGSNLFLRLSTMLMAGCFDESLRSTTDRDLCIRISDLGSVNFARVPYALVEHNAEPGRNRLTTKGSETKLSGLTAFWRKYGGRMSSKQKTQFISRAERLFSWTPTKQDRDAIQMEFILPNPPNNSVFNLLIGVITSEPETVRILLQSIRVNCANVKVLLLDNGCPADEMCNLLDEVSKIGLSVQIFGLEQQRNDAERGLFGKYFREIPDGKSGIAQARTMIQRYLGRAMQEDPNSIGWVLDDDMCLDERAKVYLPWLPTFREAGVHVLLGAYEGSSPNPPLNGLRGQLVDLIHNIHWLDKLPQHEPLPDRSNENTISRNKDPEYYYDLSRKHTSHLENPHWIEPIHVNETVIEARARLLNDASRLVNGFPLTRPLISLPPSNPLRDARDSVNRGGSTFILDYRAITMTPNSIMRIDGREARRSDMMWAIVNRYRRGLVIKTIGFPVNHIARDSKSLDFDLSKVQAEILGSAVYAGLTSFLRENPNHRLEFTEVEIAEILIRILDYRRDRLSMLKRSLYRMKGVISSVRTYFGKDVSFDWIDNLEQWTSPDIISLLCMCEDDFRQSVLIDFLSTLSQVADEYAFVDN